MYRLALLLLLIGCTGSTGDLLQKAKECGTGPECQDLWDRWNEREARKKELQKEKPKCPGDQVVYSSRHGEVNCISREQLRSLLDSLQRGY